MRPVLARVSLQPFRRQRPHGAAGLIALVGALTVLGCDRAGPPSTPTATVASEPVPEATAQVPAIATLRFASLSPAMTQMLVDLGLGDRIVGRTPFCDSVPESVPIVGSLLDVDYERLIEVAPTHIVVQPAASGTDPEVERLAQDHHWVLIEQGLDRLADVEAPGQRIAELEHAVTDKAVMDNDIGQLEEPGGAKRQQIRVAWTRADEMNDRRMHVLASPARLSRCPCGCSAR